MLGNIQMNEHRITGLTNPPSSDDEAVNKKPYGFIHGPFIPQDTQSKKSEYIESA